MAALPGTIGVNLWDMGAQGSDHTHQPGSPVNVLTNPEGVIYGSAGVVCMDFNGQMYIKTTGIELATGWCAVPCVGQNQT